MIFRNCRSASSTPAAVQRSAISPELQRFTLRCVQRTISIIDSIGFVLERPLEVAADAEPGERERLLHPLAERAGGAGVGVVELAAELPELVEGAVVVVMRPRSPQPLLHLRSFPLGEVVEQVALLVPDTTLDGGVAEDGAERLRAVDHEEDALLGIEATPDQVGEQRRRHAGVLHAPFPEPERDLDALGRDPERVVDRACCSTSWPTGSCVLR